MKKKTTKSSKKKVTKLIKKRSTKVPVTRGTGVSKKVTKVTKNNTVVPKKDTKVSKKVFDLNKILPLVQRPGRYINGELNSCEPKLDADVQVCLCFPDLYEIGASNLGLEILYNIINQRTDASAERCYTPAVDMENKMRENNIPLFSLESNRAISDFDIVGFTLQYELCITNVLSMLKLAGIPVMAEERGELSPLVIAGGPLTANPEPFVKFFDLFVLGEGEEVINEIIEKIRELNEKKTKREEVLKALSKIDGIYVPSLYNVEYNTDGTISGFRALTSDIPSKITKRMVCLEDSYFPAKQIVPFIQTVHTRLNVEIARGCSNHCRFCQASRYYHPWRLRSPGKIMDIIKEGLENTGYENVSLSSLSCTDYKGIDKILDEINTQYSSKRIGVSLPSLRCGQFSIKVASMLGSGKRSSLTFAPEAGTERLRNHIGKDLSDEQIKNTIFLAWRAGWQLIKLYFMVGLPSETESDIDGIISLVKEIKKNTPGLNFNITISPFVPKAQTPFQWEKMIDRDTVVSRIKRLERSLPASVKSHNLNSSILEAVIARGGRNLSDVIFTAWKKGCRFDQWREHFRFDLWMSAFEENNIDYKNYIYRSRHANEILPWEHLVFGADKDALRKDFEKVYSLSKAEHKTDELNFSGSENLKLPNASVLEKTIGRLQFRIERKGKAKYFSHLEQIDVFRRTLRRSELPIVFSGGFHPQVKMSFGPAVSVGYGSESEYVEAEFHKKVDPEFAKMRVSEVLPRGYSVMSVKRVPVLFPSLDSLINLAEYEVGLKVTESEISNFLKKGEVFFAKEKRGRTENINIVPLVKVMELKGGVLKVVFRFGPKKNVKCDKLIQLAFGLSEDEAKTLDINRKALYIEKEDGSVMEP